ncbi:hypothetical protein [Dickeya fangzhongdai]|uniref:hypothetical protein n=1 Tax=Dickeya fangzhongdai TaxID=1778540 RepID=UPI0026E081FB|nr:hypothetical protein [Dickeya fangzhongdai]WKV51037.1 hypothetical protein PL145_01815 [Dickeya fangzhongdai]
MKKSIIALRAGVLFFCCPLYGFSAMTDSQCTAQPAFDGSMQGVYTSGDNRYAIFNGCKYVLSGVGVGTNDASVWSGHWSPVSASTADGSGSGNTNSGTASSGSGNTGSSSGVPSTAGSSGTGSSSLSSPGSSISLTPGNLPTSSSAFETTTLGTNGPLYVAMSLTTSPSTVYAIGNEPDALAFYSLMRKLTAEDSFFLAKPTSDPCNTTTSYSGSNGSFQLPSCQKNNFKLTLTSKNSYSGSNSVSYSYNISYDYTYYNNSAVCMTASDGTRQCDPSRSVSSTSSQSSTYSIQVMANAAYYSGSSTGTVTPPPSGTASGSGTGSYSTCSYVDSSGKVTSYTAPYGTSCSSSGSSSTGTSGNTAAGSSSSAGSAFDYDRMAKAIRDGLTENYDESATQKVFPASWMISQNPLWTH